MLTEDGIATSAMTLGTIAFWTGPIFDTFELQLSH